MGTDITFNKSELNELDGLQDLLIRIMTGFINLPLDRVETEISSALKEIGGYVGADRVYIFSYDFAKQICTNTHEWCASGIEPQIQNLQDTPMDYVQEWVNANIQGHAIHIPDILALPPGTMRDTLEPQGIKSLLALPMMSDNHCLGFVGFDWVKNHHNCEQTEYHILELFARMLANISIRKKAVRESDYLREKLSQMAKLDAMGRMAGGIAHDFGNLLTVIQSHSHLALKKVTSDHPLYHHLKEIDEVAMRSADLTRRLMAFARKQEYKPVMLNLNKHISDELAILNHLAGRTAKIEWLPGHNLWPVKIDPSQLDQVLTNLVINSRDAIREKGTIKILTANVTRPGQADGSAESTKVRDFVKLEVSDDGCGMDEATANRVFEPFFTTKEEGKGTGLGLPTVFGILKQNGGFIEVISTPGQGTQMMAYIPSAAKN